jgi:hypothetical protein
VNPAESSKIIDRRRLSDSFRRTEPVKLSEATRGREGGLIADAARPRECKTLESSKTPDPPTLSDPSNRFEAAMLGERARGRDGAGVPDAASSGKGESPTLSVKVPVGDPSSEAVSDRDDGQGSDAASPDIPTAVVAPSTTAEPKACETDRAGEGVNAPESTKTGVARRIADFGSGVDRRRDDATSGAVAVRDFDGEEAIEGSNPFDLDAAKVADGNVVGTDETACIEITNGQVGGVVMELRTTVPVPDVWIAPPPDAVSAASISQLEHVIDPPDPKPITLPLLPLLLRRTQFSNLCDPLR